MARRKQRLNVIESPPLYSASVLVISETSKDAAHITTILQEESHTIEVVRTLGQAFENILASDAPYQVVIVDTSKKASLSTFMELRTDYIERQFILLAKNPGAEQIIEAFRAGATDFLSKPFHPELLKQAVRRALEYHHICKISESTESSGSLANSLKMITACKDGQTLNRIAPQIFARHFPHAAIAVQMFLQEDRKKARFVPISAEGFDRQKHARIGDFLTWFYAKSWRRFNKLSVLRGTYKPWSIKKTIGRFNMLVPIRHKAGLWGALLISRNNRRNTSLRKDKIQAATLALHLARTHYILNHYEESERRAFIDSLTGLYNQRYFSFYGDREFYRAKKRKTPLSILTINVASFKKVNDVYGHIVGGQILSHVASLLKKATRETDVLVRLDGDWFLALLRGTGKGDSKIVERRIHQALSENDFKTTSGEVVQLGAKVSSASYPENGQTLQEILDASRRMQKEIKVGKST